MTQPAPWSFQDSPVLLAALDEDLVCRYASQAWLTRLHKTTRKDELALPLAEIIALADQPELSERFNALLHNDTLIHEVPVSLLGKTGITRGLLSAWRVRDEDGRLWLYLTATCSDELNLALEELQRLRTRHELILNAAGEGIYGLDCEGRTTFGNAATMEILGWKPENIMGKKAHDVHHHSHLDGTPYPRSECPIYAALKDGEVHRVDNEVFWHTNGSAVPVEYTSTPIWENGKLNGAVVVFREDLFYRLSVFPLEVPPLRERAIDIAPLAQHFIERTCVELGRDPLRLSNQQVESLQQHSWPGNIRELKNVIERAVILSNCWV